jgi:F0F1-type ATP synthase membrane subunit c/vacuolar-type H+-ATPase subunit K
VTLSLGQALAYSLGPALAGLVAGLALLAPLLRITREHPQSKGQALVLASLLEVGPLLCFVAAFVTSQRLENDGLAWPLVALGAAAAIQAVAQAIIIRTGFEAVAKDPTKFGRLLVRTVLPETLTFAVFIYVFMQTGRLPSTS